MAISARAGDEMPVIKSFICKKGVLKQVLIVTVLYDRRGFIYFYKLMHLCIVLQ